MISFTEPLIYTGTLAVCAHLLRQQTTSNVQRKRESSMSTGGPRLGKLKGLKREDEEDDPQAMQRRASKKGGIKVRKNYNNTPRFLRCLLHT